METNKGTVHVRGMKSIGGTIGGKNINQQVSRRGGHKSDYFFFELGLIKRRGYNYSVHTMPERVATIESVITSYTWHRGTKVGDDIILHTTRVATS